MNDLDRDSVDFGKGGIVQTFGRVFVPTLAGMLFSAIFILTDGIFVGHGIGNSGLAAVNLVVPIFNIATALGMMFAVGVSVIAAIHLSQGNAKAARIIVTQAYMAILALGLILGIVLYSFPTAILKILGTSEVLMPMCTDYYLWFIPCILFLMVQMVGQFVIRLDGSPKFASLVEIIPACINIFLDWLFIFPLDYGIAGAAAATSIGGFAGIAMVTWYMARRCHTLRLYRLKCSVTSVVLTFRNMAYMVKVGISAFLGEFTMSVLTLVGNRTFIEALGEDGVAAYSVVCYLIPVVFMVYSAISQSAQPIISFNYGAGDSRRVGRTFGLTIGLSAFMGLVFTVFFYVFSKPIVSVFLVKTSSAYALCIDGLPLYSLGFVFMAIALTVIGYFQSVEKSFVATVLTLLRGLVLPVAALLTLPSVWHTAGLWLSVPIAEALTTVAIVIFAVAGVFRIDSRA